MIVRVLIFAGLACLTIAAGLALAWLLFSSLP